MPAGVHAVGAPAAEGRADSVVLHWSAHPCWPLRHNAGRALALLRAGGRAVLLVRGARQRSYGHALFPTDLSPASLAGLRRAVRTLPGMRFTLLHGYRVSGEGSMRAAGIGDSALDACRRSSERAARAAAGRFAVLASPCAAQVVVHAQRQPWAEALAAHALMARADVLVLPDRRGGVGAGWRRQADLRTLLRRTDCDLLLLPGLDAV
jgi:hypothetical protein